ncbi:unnamed protein product, partial [Meganyctiphanes norvegica]
EEPPKRLWFMSSAGAWVTCRAAGTPTPVVTWVTNDGAQVTSIPGVREIFSNGTLKFNPFTTGGFRTTVHSTNYYCQASSSVGTIISRTVNVRAVVEQYWEVRLYNQHVQVGNVAMLMCSVPSYMKDFITITSWTQGHINYYPSQQGDSRIQMVSTGQLVVKDVRPSDAQLSFRCRASHTLTGQTRESRDQARIYVTEGRVSVGPSIPETAEVVRVQRGGVATLLCPAHAHPAPTI